MPLVRLEVRNEYALGAPEMYTGMNEEDPKEILEGVAVAGLVGVLRQLGDLAEFAAEVFHGLQEDVMITTSRSHKLLARVQRIEAALFPLEKAVLAQRSHLHFAYTAGSNWRAHIRCEQNHFVCNDAPQFIMDSYEDCRGPPRLYLLDRFDPGGPGSCMKRYSDPTLFKRASVASGEAKTERSLKDKKSRKIKKRKSWPRSGEVSRGASFSYHSGRMQFAQLNVGGNSSPSQSTSTYDATLRSDLGEQSNLDLRNGSGYVEGDFRSSYSVQPEELESRESFSSPVKRHDSDFLDYNFLEQKVTDVCDVQINISQERAGCSSSSVTWDEKAETLEPTAKQFDTSGLKEEDVYDPIIDSFLPNLGLEALGDNVVCLETVDKVDTKPFNEAVPPLATPDIHLDDFESETDQFMDALNTIESESETDIDCTKKNEVEHYSNMEDIGVDDKLCELVNHDSECQSSNSGSNVLANGYLINDSFEHNPISVSPKSLSAAYCSVNEVTAKIELNSDSSVDKDLPSALETEESSNPSSLQKADSLENGNIDDSTNVEFVSGAVLSNFSDDEAVAPVIDGAKSSSESQKPLPETSNVTSVMFWTNGGLLGLQPSKPPDCSLLNALPQDPLVEKSGQNCHSNQHHILGDKDAGKTENNQNFEDSLESGSSVRKTSWKISPADLEIKLGKAGNLLYPNIDNSTLASTVASRILLPVNSEFQATKKHQENSKSSSRMFELSNRLLTTGSNRKLLHGGNENSSPASFQDAGAFEEKLRQNVAFRTFSGRTKDLVGGGSPMLSPCASPPLEHMKISFQPIDGFGTPKLKLKFPDGNYNNEISRDIFPSFQLVPEVFNSQKNDGSDSDDDTFYRSSPSLIDDSLSHQSESNSEQWESGESPCSKDHNLYDAFRQISLTESVSADPGNGKGHERIPENCGLEFPFAENGMKISKYCHSFELQSLETQDHSIREELTKDPNSLNLVEQQFTATPATPPLPPVQWRGMKPHQDPMEDKATPEASKYEFDLKLSACAISQQPKPAPLNQDQITETTNLQNSKDMHKFNGQREANQRKCTDENDFLHQIRTKSFNLRPTVTTKPTAPSGGLANVKVNAILEKANAVRQAVGSDDGEDDGNWSDI